MQELLFELSQYSDVIQFSSIYFGLGLAFMVLNAYFSGNIMDEFEIFLTLCLWPLVLTMVIIAGVFSLFKNFLQRVSESGKKTRARTKERGRNMDDY